VCEKGILLVIDAMRRPHAIPGHRGRQLLKIDRPDNQSRVFLFGACFSSATFDCVDSRSISPNSALISEGVNV